MREEQKQETKGSIRMEVVGPGARWRRRIRRGARGSGCKGWRESKVGMNVGGGASRGKR